MPARKPEECDLLLIEAIQKGDLDAALALYEPNATFVLDSGEVITGHAAIREVAQGYLALKPKFTQEVKALVSGSSLYRVSVGIAPVSPRQWRDICGRVGRSKLDFDPLGGTVSDGHAVALADVALDGRVQVEAADGGG